MIREGFPQRDPPPEPLAPGTVRPRLLAPLLAACAFAIVLAGVHSPIFDLDRHAVPKELVLHVAALVAIVLVVRDVRRVRASVVDVALAALVAWSALSTVLSVNHWLALRALGLTFSGFVLFLAARRVARQRPAGLLLGALGAAATLAAALGAAQAYGLDLDWLAGERPPGGTFGNRNFLAHLVTIALPAILLMALRAGNRIAAGLWLIAIAVCVDAIVLTRSRAAWLGLAASLAVMAVCAVVGPGRGRAPVLARRRLGALTLAIVAGAAAAVALPNRLEWRSDSPYAETIARVTDFRSGSGRGRIIQYSNTLRLAADDPVFGTGPGNWFVHYPRVTTRGDPSFSAGDPIPTNPWPSSDWVALLAERGGIAVLLALAAGAAMVVAAARRLRAAEAGTALEAITLLGTLTAAVVTGLFDAVLLNAAPTCFVAVSAGLLLPRLRPIIDRPLEGRVRTVSIAAVTAAAALFAVLSAAQLAAIRITAQSQTREAVERAVTIDPGNHRLRLRLLARGPCASRVEHARVAARLLPWHEAPRRALAACGPG